LTFDEFTLDFIPRIKADIKFLEAFYSCEKVILKGVTIPYLSLDDLIEDKKSSPRKKDIEDLAKLLKISESKK
jgi:predicted nucleotidyltransferase